MTLSQPGQVPKSYSGLQLDSSADVPITGPTTVSGYRLLYTGSQFGVAEYDSNKDKSELNLWNNDGSVACNVSFDKPYILDVAYDYYDEVYYAARWVGDGRSTSPVFPAVNEGGAETATGLFSTSFESSLPLAYLPASIPYVEVIGAVSYKQDKPVYRVKNRSRWVDYNERYFTDPAAISGQEWGYSESSVTSSPRTATHNLLNVDLLNNRMTYYSNDGSAIRTLDAEFSGDLLCYIDLDVTTLEADAVFGLRVLGDTANDISSFNQLGSVCYRGVDTSPTVQAWTVNYVSDSTSDMWGICNVRVNEVYLAWGAGGVKSVANDTIEHFKAKVVGYRLSRFAPDIHIGTPPAAEIEEHVLAFDVVDAAGTSFGAGVLSSNVRLDTVDYAAGDYCWSDFHRSFSWAGSSGQVMGFDAVVGFGFDPETGVISNPVTHSVLGSSVDIKVGLHQESLGIANNVVRLAIKREGSTITFLKRDSSVAGGAYTTVHSFDSGYTGNVKFEVFADATKSVSPPDVVCTSVVVRSLFPSEQQSSYTPPESIWRHALVSVEAYDKDGHLDDSAPIAASGGRVLTYLDMLNVGVDFDGRFDSVRGTVQLCTNHLPAALGGELYLGIGPLAIKYLKTALPIIGLETGVLASTSGTTSLATAQPNTLSWNGYTEAGLVYMAENVADPGAGWYVNCLRHTTMEHNSPIKFSWVDQAADSYSLYCTDSKTPSVLYGFSPADKKIYLYNLDEDVTAFCNVVGVEQIMGAGTAETSVVTAQVLNAYGDPLAGKTVTFSVSSGDGSVSPASAVTDALGEASTTYTVGATVGTATVRASVVD